MSVRNAILIFLDSGPDHGFSLKKRFESATSDLWPLNVGQVYSTLQRLERDGLVRALDTSNATGDPTEQRQYEITDAGRTELNDWIVEPRTGSVPDRDDLIIKLAALIASGHRDVSRLIDSQRASTTQSLHRFTRLKAGIPETDIAQLLSVDAVLFRIEAELKWLNHLQARLKGMSS